MITSTTFAVECDGCRKAFAYPEISRRQTVADALSSLTDHGWTMPRGKHLCPRCSPTPVRLPAPALRSPA